MPSSGGQVETAQELRCHRFKRSTAARTGAHRVKTWKPSNSSARKSRARRLLLETLQHRELLAGDLGPGVCYPEPPPSLPPAAAPPPASTPPAVPEYSSLPSATKKIYLDFNGQDVSGTLWNKSWNDLPSPGSTINAPAFDLDNDTSSFSVAELDQIREIWARVAEDYRPFNVDVTTVEPALSDFTVGSTAIRVIISTDYEEDTGLQWYRLSDESPADGAAYQNSWTYTSDTPVWVFHNNLGSDEKNIAEAASHYAGRSFSLLPDGRTSPAETYYEGHGSGAEGWAPIMGSGYSRQLTQWSSGEYTNANQFESDFSKIAGFLGERTDDHGNAIGTASGFVVDPIGNVSQEGVISNASDVDVFSFFTRDGDITLTVDAFEAVDGKANLDIGLMLLDSGGSTVTSDSPLDQLGATISETLTEGTYYLVVDGVGRPADGSQEGYSDYGSLGAFSVSGNIVVNIDPVAEDDAVNTLVDEAILIDVLQNDSDAEDDTLTITDVGTPANGTATIVGNEIEYEPDPGFVGIDTFTYDIDDGYGGTDQATVTVHVLLPVQVETVTFDDGTGQRSRMQQIQIVFDREVAVGENAILVEQRGASGGVVDTSVLTSDVDGKTIAVVTFSGAFTETDGSLVDGNYQLTIFGAEVVDGDGNLLDGDGDEVVGGDYVVGDEEADAFFRLFGDYNGNRVVNFDEFFLFRAAFGSSAGDANYVSAIDMNSDDVINFDDFFLFRDVFGNSLSFE